MPAATDKPAPAADAPTTADLMAQLAQMREELAALKAKPADVDQTHDLIPLAPLAVYTGKTYDTYRVTIKRDETSHIPVDVPKYEVPILRAAHGPDKVSVSKDPVGKIQLITDDAAQEYQRLFRRYDRKNEVNPVTRAYPDRQRLADAMGLDYDRQNDDEGTQLEASQQIDHSKPDADGAKA